MSNIPPSHADPPAPEPYPGPPTGSVYPGPPQPAAPKPGNGLATAGFVLGLLGLLGSLIPVINIGGMVLGVVGAILAAVGLVKARKVGTGKGLALAGLILGVLAVIVAIIINITFVSAVDSAVDDALDASRPTVEAPTATDNAEEGSPESAPPAEEDTAPEPAPETGLGTTRSNPAPIGSAIVDRDWTVTINSVTTVAEDARGRTPADGSTLLLVNLTATYTGDDEQGESAWASVDFITAEGTTIGTLDGSSYFTADDPFDSLATLYSGGSVTGNKIFEVPAEGWQEGVLAVTPRLFSDKTFVAVQ